METSEYRFAADVATVFHDFLVVEGWFYHPSDPIASVTLVGKDVMCLEQASGFCHEGVRALGTNCGFRIKAFLQGANWYDLQIVFTTKAGAKHQTTMEDLTGRQEALTTPDRLYTQFRGLVSETEGARLLDVGGRNRSGLDHSKIFAKARCTVFDIKAGENVNVVGDAHRLSKYFEPGAFDFIHSVSVFEHLAMPWMVVAEMNRVLKIGGVAFVATHQCIGLHDYPWDFWRFSDRAFYSLFNAGTGFEVFECEMNTLNFVVPFHLKRRHSDYLKTGGFETSCVLARKIGPTTLEWSVDGTEQKNIYPG